MKKLWPLAFLTFLGTLGCNKEPGPPPAPPDVNEQGEYFNCYINGKYWTFKQDPYAADALSASVSQITLPGYRLHAVAHDGYPRTVIDLWMIGENVPSKDTFDLTTYSDGSYAEILGPTANFCCSGFGTDMTHTGKLIFSRRGDRLEGTFYFDAQRPDTNVVIHVTNGRFSIIPD